MLHLKRGGFADPDDNPFGDDGQDRASAQSVCAARGHGIDNVASTGPWSSSRESRRTPSSAFLSPDAPRLTQGSPFGDTASTVAVVPPCLHTLLILVSC